MLSIYFICRMKKECRQHRNGGRIFRECTHYTGGIRNNALLVGLAKRRRKNRCRKQPKDLRGAHAVSHSLLCRPPRSFLCHRIAVTTQHQRRQPACVKCTERRLARRSTKAMGVAQPNCKNKQCFQIVWTAQHLVPR